MICRIKKALAPFHEAFRGSIHMEAAGCAAALNEREHRILVSFAATSATLGLRAAFQAAVEQYPRTKRDARHRVVVLATLVEKSSS